jgi:predicted nucleic acid-binding protein
LKRTQSEIEGTLRAIRMKALWVKPTAKIRASPDPNDDIFLECAQEAGAHYLVTGNAKHFPSTWAGTRIVTARQFLDGLA